MRKSLFYLLMVALFSCEATDESLLNAPQDSFSSEKNFVSLDYAKSIASVYNGSYIPAGDELVTRGVEVRQVSQTMTVKNDNGTPVFYIINMEGGGFRVISADNRLEPVLASGEEGTLTNEIIGENPGLQMWMDGMIEHVTSVRASNVQQSEVAKALWNDMNPIQPMSDIPSSPECSYAGQTVYDYNYIGPQLSTQWHQGADFNAEMEYGGCSENDGKYLLGCSTIATGIVMRYKQKPGFPWSEMPWDEATPNTALFLKEVSEIIGVDPGCESSPGPFQGMCDALRYYGYNNASIVDYSSSGLVSQIRSQDVVIMYGANLSTNQAHVWVVSGARSMSMYRCDETPYGTLVKTHILTNGYDNYYIDWGWNDNTDGWYSESGFKYKDRLQLLINIY